MYRVEENEMESRTRHRETIGSSSVVGGIVVLIVAFATSSASTALAVDPIAAEVAVKSQWDDEPVENLNAAPNTERASKRYSWEQQYAETDAKGGLEWMPRPFVFEAGDSVRYIDFEEGRDGNDGKTRGTAWKHHPWDGKAIGQAATCSGEHTYVFKRGVSYRSTLIAQDSGQPSNPIRLTSDPSWGDGEAVLCGSEKITDGWKKGAEHRDIPNKGKVWYRDIDFAPRNVWMVRGETITRIPLARMPNWTVSDPEDVKKEWWSWDNPGHPYFDLTMKSEDGRRELAMGRDTKHITGLKELYMGAIIWAEFGWVDGTPYPSYVQGFDASKSGLGFQGYLGSPKSRVICRNHRYYLEDKPHYLDDEDGEFWFEKKGNGGRLHVILPGGQDPNDAVIEAAKETTLVDLTGRRQITVSGLSFSFTNVAWDLTEIPWQYSNRFRLKKHIYPACVRVWGTGEQIEVANCRFNHVNNGVLMKAVNPGDRLDRIVVRDCEFRETDHNGITIEEGLLWGDTLPDRAGHLFDVKILRNYSYRTGLRSPRVGSANAINIDNAQTLEIAGNVAERAWHAGINVRGAKISGNVRDCPLSRVLIYQNKVTDAIRTGDDCGNIETWQGGPAYVFNNVSGNPGGYRHGQYMSDQEKKDPGGARFGMAYYLDGSYKNYFFNNIGWGLTKDIRDRTGATTMFQEIISYQNMFFNNTAYQFVKGTRRQAPQAGRNKFMGNIWDGIDDWVFWHTKPAKTPEDGNERDAGQLDENYALETNAFTGNVFHDIAGKYGSFKSSGKWHKTFEEARQVLEEVKSIAFDLGVESRKPPMKNPAGRDFSLADGSAAVDRGVKAFVPWATYANVGEWNFYPAGNDPARLIDEHWYMTPYYYVRDKYYLNPRFPLTGVNFTKNNYVDGPLEDWTKGACTFNGKDQYAVCSNEKLNRSLTIPIKFRWDKSGQAETREVGGKDFRSPQVYDSNFLIEAYFKTASGHTKGTLCQKISSAGYSLTINPSGGVTFAVCGEKTKAKARSTVAVNDGRWHHVIAECDRDSQMLVLSIDGTKNSEATGIGSSVSLSNSSDLYVGGTPQGANFHGTFEFLRISLGTLKDAKTDIAELYAWQFDGPFLYDFAGNRPQGKRDAGALEKVD
jgi:concanavalin A-like lectin/glucanase superfamily protein